MADISWYDTLPKFGTQIVLGMERKLSYTMKSSGYFKIIIIVLNIVVFYLIILVWFIVHSRGTA